MRYRRSLIACLVLGSLSAQANVLQYFTGISYSNPAELFKVQNNEFILGANLAYGLLTYEGSALNFNTFQYETGKSDSERAVLLPYARIAKRIDKRMVVGIDVTEPYNSLLYWGENAFTRYGATESILTDVDFSPRFSYSITPQLYAGGGVNFNFLVNNETNWVLPTGPTTYANMINRSSSFGAGYNAGLYWVMNATNFLGASYYSSIGQFTRGTSRFNSTANTDFHFKFKIPPTLIFNYVHIFNPQWLVSLFLFKTYWSVNQNPTFSNTAAPPPLNPNFVFSTHFSNSYAVAGAIRRQINDQWGLTLLAVQDNTPSQDRLRTINFPTDTQYFAALIADYHATKTTTFEFLAGEGYSRPTIQNTVSINGQAIPFMTGKVRIDAPTVELKVKVQA